MNTIHLDKAVVRNPVVRLTAPVSVDFGTDEHIAVFGPNGAGKSLLVDMLTGKYPLLEGKLKYDFSPIESKSVYENVKYLTFKDTFGIDGGYYQQRWNAHDQDEAPSVRELLGTGGNESMREMLFTYFHLDRMFDEKVLLLSSGEIRKLQIIKALLAAPRILILDNPFIGLDVEARQLLSFLLSDLIGLGCLQIVLVVSRIEDIPPFITHVIPVDEREVGPKLDVQTFITTFRKYADDLQGQLDALGMKIAQHILSLPVKDDGFVKSDEVVRLNKVSIRYGSRTILKELDWTVHKGEKWALCGENGSGKSTLLSLVCADNPQSYACDISLFGRKRGSGESIWEIKKHIGYVSPEMHRTYLKNIPAIEIVASGLHDSIGLYVRPHEEDLSICQWWMNIFGVSDLRDKPFLQLSSGEQRLVLLARAFVKDPELLILDEPLHGLDTFNRIRVKQIIEAFCRRSEKTLIMVTHYEEELPAVITHRLQLKKN